VYNYQTWNYLNGNVYVTNQILDDATTKTPLQTAEAKFIRAYNMFWIFDLWRQIPFRTPEQGPKENPSVMSGQEAFDFIVKDLTDAMADLPTVSAGDIGNQIRASKAACNYMLAKMYLNKNIYLGGTVQAADMTKVIDYVTAIEGDGYSLQDGYFSIFGPEADSETIFYSNGQYAQRIWGSLHYNQGRDTDNLGGGWNGFATTAEFYASFEGNPDDNSKGQGQEERRGYVPNDSLGIGFLIGQQYGPHDAAHPDGKILARSGKPLVFTKDVPALTGNPDYTGIRLLKWHPTINMPGTWGNHLVLMRYADAYLMKAEALFRNGDASTAQSMINDLRALRKCSTMISSITADDILAERGRELYLEGWRRNDMVRFGKFNTQFAFVADTSEGRDVFPVPENAVGTNPNLKQNTGY
jgi:hypothetical protein